MYTECYLLISDQPLHSAALCPPTNAMNYYVIKCFPRRSALNRILSETLTTDNLHPKLNINTLVLFILYSHSLKHYVDSFWRGKGSHVRPTAYTNTRLWFIHLSEKHSIVVNTYNRESSVCVQAPWKPLTSGYAWPQYSLRVGWQLQIPLKID